MSLYYIYLLCIHSVFQYSCIWNDSLYCSILYALRPHYMLQKCQIFRPDLSICVVRVFIKNLHVFSMITIIFCVRTTSLLSQMSSKSCEEILQYSLPYRKWNAKDHSIILFVSNNVYLSLNTLIWKTSFAICIFMVIFYLIWYQTTQIYVTDWCWRLIFYSHTALLILLTIWLSALLQLVFASLN